MKHTRGLSDKMVTHQPAANSKMQQTERRSRAVSVFKKSAAALAAFAGLAVTSSGFAADPFFSTPATVFGKQVAAPVTYRKVCTPTGCYFVPVTSAQTAQPRPAQTAKPTPVQTAKPATTPAPAGYRKVCTPTGCYLVPLEDEAVTAPVKNYRSLFEALPSPSEAAKKPATSAAPNGSPFYTQEPGQPSAGKTPATNRRPTAPAATKPTVVKKVGGSLPSPFYP
jgi:hypothetical protein